MAWITTAFTIEPEHLRFRTSVGLEIRPFDVPPCSLREYNGLMIVGGDKNLDGATDIVSLAELEVNEDSSVLRLSPARVPTIDSVVVFGSSGGHRHEPARQLS